MSKKMNRNQRRRARREAHTRDTQARNHERGYSSSVLKGAGGSNELMTPAIMELINRRTTVGKDVPSFHKSTFVRQTKQQLDATAGHVKVDVMGRNPSERDWQEMKDEAKTRKKSIKVLAQRRGWGLRVGDHVDPKQRESWVMS